MRKISKAGLYVAVAVMAVAAAEFTVASLRSPREIAPRPDLYPELRSRISRYADSLNCTLGVAVIFDEGDTLTVGNGEMYPLMSIVKLPLALAACRNFEKEGRPLSDLCTLKRSDWVPYLWSPLRRGRRSIGTFTIEQLFEFLLAYSDNDVCQYFFDHFCTREQTLEFIGSLGIEGFRIPYDYREISEDQERWHDDAATPYATAQILEYLYANCGNPYVSTVWDIMADCRTGRRRIPAGIPDKRVVIAHKTGTSGNGRDGRLRSISDAAVVILPDGRHFSIAVYVKDASFGKRTAAKAIARVTRLVYDEYSVKKVAKTEQSYD